jgi:hypothetical protein
VKAATIIGLARDEHPAFTERFTPDGVCYNYLEQYHTLLARKLLKADRDALLTIVAVPLPLANFDAGYNALPARIVLEDTAFLVDSVANRCRAQRVDGAQRHNPRVFPSFTFENGVIYQTRTAAYWTDYTSLELRYTPEVTIDPLTDDLVLPNDAQRACVLALAAFMGRRIADRPGLPPIDRGGLAQGAAAAEAEFLLAHEKAIVSEIREVW